jgi:uncharacterized protein with LGFP repeats
MNDNVQVMMDAALDEASTAITNKWSELGGSQSFLGDPQTEVLVCPDGIGSYQSFAGGSIYWSPNIGAFEVNGGIRDKWISLGAEQSLLGYPTSDETPTLDGIGRYQSFAGGPSLAAGYIYWSPNTGACVVRGGIWGKWISLGAEQSFLGYPITDETPTPDGIGSYNHFQGGSIYWSLNTDAYEVHGAIRDKWSSLGAEQFYLGYPTTDETSTPDGIGRFNHFERGSIYWTPSIGAYEVQGGIWGKWISLGAERSYLGYPITDEIDFTEGGRVSVFEHGSIYWWPDTGTIELNDVVVYYNGLFCPEESDWDQGTNSDEPYVVIGIVSPTGTTTTMRTDPYSDVDSGETRPDSIELYRGKPIGLVLNVLVMENDDGVPDNYKQAMQDAITNQIKDLAPSLAEIPYVGPVLAAADILLAPKLGEILSGALTDAINAIFGLGDDRIGETAIPISAKEVIVIAAQTQYSTFKNIGFKKESPEIKGDGARYKVYFGIDPV